MINAKMKILLCLLIVNLHVYSSFARKKCEEWDLTCDKEHPKNCLKDITVHEDEDLSLVCIGPVAKTGVEILDLHACRGNSVTLYSIDKHFMYDDPPSQYQWVVDRHTVEWFHQNPNGTLVPLQGGEGYILELQNRSLSFPSVTKAVAGNYSCRYSLVGITDECLKECCEICPWYAQRSNLLPARCRNGTFFEGWGSFSVNVSVEPTDIIYEKQEHVHVYPWKKVGIYFSKEAEWASLGPHYNIDEKSQKMDISEFPIWGKENQQTLTVDIVSNKSEPFTIACELETAAPLPDQIEWLWRDIQREVDYKKGKEHTWINLSEKPFKDGVWNVTIRRWNLTLWQVTPRFVSSDLLCQPKYKTFTVVKKKESVNCVNVPGETLDRLRMPVYHGRCYYHVKRQCILFHLEFHDEFEHETERSIQNISIATNATELWTVVRDPLPLCLRAEPYKRYNIGYVEFHFVLHKPECKLPDNPTCEDIRKMASKPGGGSHSVPYCTRFQYWLLDWLSRSWEVPWSEHCVDRHDNIKVDFERCNEDVIRKKKKNCQNVEPYYYFWKVWRVQYPQDVQYVCGKINVLTERPTVEMLPVSTTIHVPTAAPVLQMLTSHTTIILSSVGSGLIFIIVIIVIATCLNYKRRNKDEKPIKSIRLELKKNVLYSRDASGLEPCWQPHVVIEGQDGTTSTTDLVGRCVYNIPDQKEWEIARHRIQLENIIGEGAFGVVRMGTVKGIHSDDELKKVAIKSLKDNATESELKMLLTELMVLKHLTGTCSHPYIICFIGCCTSKDGPVNLVMEYAEKGSLLDLLRAYRACLRSLDPFYLHEVANAYSAAMHCSIDDAYGPQFFTPRPLSDSVTVLDDLRPTASSTLERCRKKDKACEEIMVQVKGDPNFAKRSRLLSETSEVTEASETSQTLLLRLDSRESEDDVFRKERFYQKPTAMSVNSAESHRPLLRSFYSSDRSECSEYTDMSQRVVYQNSPPPSAYLDMSERSRKGSDANSERDRESVSIYSAPFKTSNSQHTYIGEKIAEANCSLDVFDRPLSHKMLLRFGEQIAEAMSHLANIGIVHRDLACRNILLNKDLCIKLSDFGLTRVLEESDYYKKNSHGRVPIKWLSPEAIIDGKYTSKGDVWSFGIVMWELFSLGAKPYYGVMAEQVAPLLQEGYRMTRPSNATVNIYEVMLRCWSGDPLLRPTFQKLVDTLGCLRKNMDRDMLIQTPGSETTESRLLPAAQWEHVLMNVRYSDI